MKVDENEKYLILFEKPRLIEKDFYQEKFRKSIDNILAMQKLKSTKRIARMMRKKLVVNSELGKVKSK